MDLELNGKVALVAGASRGLGAAIADRLAREGCSLLITARGEEALGEKAEQLREHGVEVHAVAADVTKGGAAQTLVDSAVERFGGLDLLVGNAGGNRRKPFAETTDDDWADILNLNFQAHLRLARTAIPAMRKRGGGAMLFVASIFGREAGGAGLSIYNATKSALISAAKIMSLELAGEGIRVNTLAPGSIRFEGGSWDKRVKADPEAMKQFVADNIPLGRFGTAEEIGDVAAFLLSARASLITGACLNADGGQSKSLI